MRKILYSLIVLVSSISLASCDDDDDYLYYYDPYLPGQWQLTYINGYPVTGYDTNWLDFYNDGGGTYYYYDNGVLMQMGLSWFVNGDYTWLYVDYADGVSLDCNYWYTNNRTRLYLQWYDGYGQQTYVYDYVANPDPWYAPAAKSIDSATVTTDSVATKPFTTAPFGNRPVRTN